MLSCWTSLRQKRRRLGVCICCAGDDHSSNECIYKKACYVCLGPGHKSWCCPIAREERRQAAIETAPTQISTSEFLTQTRTQAQEYASVGVYSRMMTKLQDKPQEATGYAQSFRASRQSHAYIWGLSPDQKDQPIYVRGLAPFELLPVFQALLPGDFTEKATIRANRYKAWNLMRENIDKMVHEAGYKDEFIIKTVSQPTDIADGLGDNDHGCRMVSSSPSKSPSPPSTGTTSITASTPQPQIGSTTSSFANDILVDSSVIASVEGMPSVKPDTDGKSVTTIHVNNPLSLASRDGDLDLAQALLHYATYGEETTQLIDIVAYNKRNVNIEKWKHPNNNNLYSVILEGVGEGRPSVLRGDKILLSAGPGGRMYGGVVHFVNVDEIVFAMPVSCSQVGTMDLIFILPRTQERSYHRALASKTEWFLTQELCLRDFRSTFPSHHIDLTNNTGTNTIDINSGSDNINNNYPQQQALVTTNSNDAVNNDNNKKCYNFKIPTKVHAKALNEKQSEFVAHVLNLEHHVSLLWGPPGTGKTVSMIAAIAELLVSSPTARILVVTPSNEAADLIVERLHPYLHYLNSLPPGEDVGQSPSLFRAHSLSRSNKVVSDVVKIYSTPSPGGGFVFPTKAKIESTTITVATMMTSDRLNGIGVSYDHFTHVFVDEAGHATEQLLALPLSLASQRRCKVVLAGDPKQLGPRIRSQPLVVRRVQESTLARLMSEERVWDQCGVQLVENYRSHPAIIHIINSFYQDKLVPASVEHGGRFQQQLEFFQQQKEPDNDADTTTNASTNTNTTAISSPLTQSTPQTSKYSQWSRLPNKSAPILCIDHDQPEERKRDSPSWFNKFEVDQVMSIIHSLVFEEKICKLQDIAVITPYSKQVQEIENVVYWDLVHRGILVDSRPRPPSPVKVATIDSYQGRESNVVILSCVRSNVTNIGNDLKFHMGFLSQPQRTNVAMSRARELLVVIGNTELLSLDPLFGEYFKRMVGLNTLVSHRPKITKSPGQIKSRLDAIHKIKSMLEDHLDGGDVDDNGDDKENEDGANEQAWARHE